MKPGDVYRLNDTSLLYIDRNNANCVASCLNKVQADHIAYMLQSGIAMPIDITLDNIQRSKRVASVALDSAYNCNCNERNMILHKNWQKLNYTVAQPWLMAIVPFSDNDMQNKKSGCIIL